MPIANAVVATLLRSPAHGLLSGSVDLVRYTGRRSGRQFTTPTQYALIGNDVVILVGRHRTRTWWRNFTTDHDIDVLLRRQWEPMRARAVIGADEPQTIAPLLDAFLEKFPKASRVLDGATSDSQRRSAVVVWFARDDDVSVVAPRYPNAQLPVISGSRSGKHRARLNSMTV